MIGSLSIPDAREILAGASFSTAQVGRIGVELEWISRRSGEPCVRPSLSSLHEAIELIGALPFNGAISLEPGGQLELSSAPASCLVECANNVRSEVDEIRQAFSARGMHFAASAYDHGAPELIVPNPRYLALQRHYERFGPAGALMMCNTASVQVNVDAGDDSDGWTGRRRRWRLANALGPILMAIFANSPGRSATGWRSTRQVLRFHTDPTRTAPVRTSGDPVSEWVRYALDANVVWIRDPESADTIVVPEALTMRQWLNGAGPRRPTAADLIDHTKMLIPPVRARGYLEFRMIDAQSDDNWIVPAAFVGCLLDDSRASDQAVVVVRSTRARHSLDEWRRAAKRGLDEDDLARAAMVLARLVLEVLDRWKAPPWLQGIVGEFVDRYTLKGRCPADLARRGCC